MFSASVICVRSEKKSVLTLTIIVIGVVSTVAKASMILDGICSKSNNGFNSKLSINEFNRPNPITNPQQIQLRPLLCFARDALRGNISFFLFNKNNSDNKSFLRNPISSPSLVLVPLPLALLWKYQSQDQSQQFLAPLATNNFNRIQTTTITSVFKSQPHTIIKSFLSRPPIISSTENINISMADTLVHNWSTITASATVNSTSPTFVQQQQSTPTMSNDTILPLRETATTINANFNMTSFETNQSVSYLSSCIEKILASLIAENITQQVTES